jgi:hypothetical protein
VAARQKQAILNFCKAGTLVPAFFLCELNMPRRLMPIAAVNIALHVLGLFMALFGMKPGSPLVPLAERVSYLSHHPLGWSLGWGTWMLCDLAVFLFLFQAACRLRNQLAWLAVGLILAGITVDLTCDSLFIVALPQLAARQPLNEEIFLTAEKMINVVSLVMANGLITLSTVALTLALRNGEERAPYASSPAILGMGIAIFVFGMLLSMAGFMSDPWLTEWMTGPTILSYCVWSGLVAWHLDRSRTAA